MPRWQGRSKTNKAGYSIFVILIRTFGIRSGYLLLYFVAGWFYFFSGTSSRAILYYLRKRMHFGTLKSLRYLYANYFVFGQTLIDRFVMMSGLSSKFTFDFDGELHLKELVKAGKGGLLLSGHAGNWEAAGQMLNRLETRVNIVMFDGENPAVKEYLESVSGEKSFRVILVKNDLSHIYKMTEALQAGELVCMHADRFLPGNKTIATDFLGEEALFPEGPFLLALKLKVPVVYVYAFKESATHYHLYSTGIKHFSGKKGDTTLTVLKDYCASLEKMVKLYPTQWFNYYNFWQK